MIDFLQKQITIITKKIELKKQYSSYYVIIRGVLFLAFLITIYFTFKYPNSIVWLSIIICVLVFISILNLSWKNNKKLNYYQSLRKIYEQEINSFLHHSFPYANGSEFRDIDHPYINDLDIFGENSLFHLLNRCFTFFGYTFFADQLKYPLSEINSIYQRQEAIKELQRNEKDFVFHLLAILSENFTQQATDNLNLKLWLQQNIKIITISKILLFFVYIIPYINFVLLCLSIVLPYLFPEFFSLVLIQGILLNHCNKSVQVIKKDLNIIIRDVINIEIYTDNLKGKVFKSPKLQQLQAQIVEHRQLTYQLRQMLNVFDMGESAIGSWVNFFFFNHLRIALKLEKWKSKNKEIVLQIMDSISELETIISLSVFSMNNPEFVFPVLSQTGTDILLNTQNIGHPLIPDEKRITNDIKILKNSFFIITGANMAGKSTFLRTIGVNLLLARIGAPVCATFFQCSPVSLFSSMRTIDNIDTRTSYFYAEALRIRAMLNFIQSGKDILLIVDELFRGTNSNDKLKSSLAFIQKILKYSNITALIATHDLGLTHLEEKYPDKVINSCFECFNCDAQITFDYKLKEGITQSYNAYRLLQEMNIVD